MLNYQVTLNPEINKQQVLNNLMKFGSTVMEIIDDNDNVMVYNIDLENLQTVIGIESFVEIG